MKNTILTFCILLFAFCISSAQSGYLDTTFGMGGEVSNFGSATDKGNSVVIQGKGKIIVAGGSNYDFALVRYDRDGSLDNTFDYDGRTTTNFDGFYSQCRSVAIQSDEKIIASGITFTGSNYDFALVRYNRNGSLDTTFGTFGKVTTDFGSSNDFGYSVVIQSDGKIVVVGSRYISYYSNWSQWGFALARYNTNGILDNTFGSGGKVITPYLNSENGGSAIIQSDGKILVAGFGDGNGNAGFAVVRYNSNGGLDNTFGNGGIVFTDFSSNSKGNSVAIQEDGKIVLAGWSINPSYNNDIALTRYHSNGTLDSTFGIEGKVTTAFGNSSEGKSVSIQSDGKIVVAGDCNNGSDRDFALIRYNSDGSLDNTFGSGGMILTDFGSNNDYGNSAIIQSDGKIVVAGYSDNGNNYAFALARYNNDFCPPVSFSQSPTICDGQSVTVGNIVHTISATYIDTLTSVYGCDSIVTTNLTVLPNSIVSQSLTICDGQSVRVGIHTYITSGTYIDILMSANGCDSIITTNLTVLPVSGFSQSPIICKGESVTVGSNIYTTEGTYKDTLIAANGCDSVVTTNLTILPISSYFQNPTICNGERFPVVNNIYTTDGIYRDTLIAANGCDSIIITTLTVLPIITFSQSPTICNGQSITVGNNIYTSNGMFIDTLISAYGCDSIVTTNITVLPDISFSQNLTICNGQSIMVGSNTYMVEGTYTAILTSVHGCDSTVTTSLTVLPNSSFFQSFTFCNGHSVAVGNHTHTTSGIFIDTLIAANGCDSVITTELIVNPTYYVTVDTSINEGNSIQVGDSIYHSTGTYLNSFITSKGCDSVVTTNLTVLTITGIEELFNGTEEWNVKIYPNPTNGKIQLVPIRKAGAGNKHSFIEIEIYNLLGEKIYSTTISRKQETVNLSSQPIGIYFVEMICGNERRCKQIILE